MGKYILSEIFTLVPAEVYTPEIAREALAGQFPLNGDVQVQAVALEKEGAMVVYPSGAQMEGVLPFAVRMMEEASSVKEYNKVVFHYSAEKRLSHTIIYIGEELKLANSFKADSFESALYFLFLSIQQLQMNPKQCVIRVCSDISQEQEETVKRFFNGVEKNNLDKETSTKINEILSND